MRDIIKTRCSEVNAEIGELMKGRFYLSESIQMVRDGSEMLDFKSDDIINIAASALQEHFDIAYDKTYILEILSMAVEQASWSAAVKTADFAFHSKDHIGTTYQTPSDMVSDVEL